jgi:flagellar biosynthetic protein FliR
MLTFTEAELQAWLTPLLWPFLRSLALFSSLPVLGQRVVPMRVRIALAFFITVAAQATLPAMPTVALDSMPAFLLAVQQVLIGLALGFAVRIVFAAVEMAGELIGLQMGLNFASFTLQPQAWGAEVFHIGLWIALPLVGMLLFVNIVLGVISRVAPQINVFAVGFPITLSVGLIGMLVTLPMMQSPFTMALERMLANFR